MVEGIKFQSFIVLGKKLYYRGNSHCERRVWFTSTGFLLHAAIVANNEEMIRRLCCCKLGRMYEDDGFSFSPFTID